MKGLQSFKPRMAESRLVRPAVAGERPGGAPGCCLCLCIISRICSGSSVRLGWFGSGCLLLVRGICAGRARLRLGLILGAVVGGCRHRLCYRPASATTVVRSPAAEQPGPAGRTASAAESVRRRRRIVLIHVRGGLGLAAADGFAKRITLTIAVGSEFEPSIT